MTAHNVATAAGSWTTRTQQAVGVEHRTGSGPITIARRRSAWLVLGEWIIVVLGLAGGMALWWISLKQFHLDDSGPLGIVKAMPASYVGAILVLAITFGVQMARRRPNHLALGMIVACLVVVLFSVPNLVDGTAQMPVAYVHAGFVQYIGEHHAILRGYDARFDWPAFFAAGSVLTSIAGLPDARPLLEGAPLFFELLALPPVLLLARSIIGRGRTAWLAVVLYYSGCWFGQDYFAPQAMGHLLYLSSIAVMFWTVSGAWEGVPQPRPYNFWELLTRRPTPPPGLTDGSAFAIQLALTTIIGAMVVTHQLTPVGFIIQLGVLSVFGVTRYRALWLVAALFFLAWFSYGAKDFWLGHLGGLVGSVGQVNSSVSKGLTSRVASGNPTYLHMQLVRTMWSGMFFAVAAVGSLVLLRRRTPLAFAATLAGLSPFVLIGLQSYGGEIFLRTFLYAMPFLAILSAAALSPLLRLPISLRGMAVTAIVVFATFGLVVTRSVNVAFERVTADSVNAAQFVVGGTQSTKIAVVESFAPVGYAGIDTHKVGELGKNCEPTLVQCALRMVPDFIFLSTEQEQYGRLRMQLPDGWLMRDGEQQLIRSAGYRVVYERPHAIVLKSTRATAKAAAKMYPVQPKPGVKVWKKPKAKVWKKPKPKVWKTTTHAKVQARATAKPRTTK